jgi:hypothetical protein
MPTLRMLLKSVLVVALGSLLACTENPRPQVLAPQTMAPIPPETPELYNDTSDEERTAAGGVQEPADDPSVPVVEPVDQGVRPTTAATEVVPVDPQDDPLTVVLDPGSNSEERPQSLFANAEAERKRRAEIGESTIVLNNETLKKYSKGEITFVEDEEGTDETSALYEDSAPAADEPDEEYWRNVVLDLRLAWRQAEDDIEEYESEIAKLRRRFYAEDDPFYRDAQIKPAWDQALNDLEEAKRTVDRSQIDLERAIEDGLRAGALPGWLREGIEFEPEIEEEDPLAPRNEREHEASEPVVIDDNGDGR